MMKLKNDAAVLVISSAACLLPILLALALYADLPERIAIHWNAAGTPDNFVSKPVAAFGMPLFLFVLSLFSKMRLLGDPKRANTSRAMQMLSIWTPPLLSLIFVPVTLFTAMGANIPIPLVSSVVVGALLLVCGNYLPKSRQNYTIGIKLPWTLHSADNWNKTHRLAGYVYLFGGIAVIAGAFLFRGGSYWVLLPIAAIIVVPVFYSYALYRKTGGNGNTDES